MVTAIFVALNDGIRGTVLATFRTIIFPILILSFLPMAIGGFTIWIAMPLSEGLSIILAAFLLWTYRKVLHFNTEPAVE